MKDLLNYHRRRKLISGLWAVVRQIFMLGISYVVLYPLMYMVSNAFKPVEQYYDPSVIWIPKSLTLDNFKVVALVMDIGEVMLNTLIISVLPAFISTTVCMMIGYGLARFDFKGKRLVIACLIRAIRGPRIADRVIAANMTGTLIVIIICILSFVMNEGYLIDIAMIYTMLSFLAVVLLTKVYMGIYREKHRQEMEKEGTQHD